MGTTLLVLLLASSCSCPKSVDPIANRAPSVNEDKNSVGTVQIQTVGDRLRKHVEQTRSLFTIENECVEWRVVEVGRNTYELSRSWRVGNGPATIKTQKQTIFAEEIARTTNIITSTKSWDTSRQSWVEDPTATESDSSCGEQTGPLQFHKVGRFSIGRAKFFETRLSCESWVKHRCALEPRT